jgi:hypothetical protein
MEPTRKKAPHLKVLLSGVFVIETLGTIRFSHRSQDPVDHPWPDEILWAAAQVKESPDER